MQVAIDYILKRKEAWLSKKVKANLSAEEKLRFEVEATEKFSRACWLKDAAKRAKSFSLSSHPCRFSHPDARKNENGETSPVVVQAKADVDGYVRSGNVDVELDALGNAADIDVYNFLMLELSDGMKLIRHIELETDLSKELLSAEGSSYEELRSGFLKIKSNDNHPVRTSSKIKQVYFPVDDDYHLLSILTPSGIVFSLRNKIQTMKFSDSAKTARKACRDSEYSSEGFADIYNLAVIGYGGTKPQNISVLNSKNGGKAYLLPSIPPSMKSTQKIALV
ncbi:type I-F CRISPR-associated protein Csy1 [Piscirickettsia litoralis]|uniref:type I-F CRISPR-associated protein Csy1 n=1 Tax=Piscirickettsia litoralis TaxID=1891921 RepID=UPI000AB74596|nr:type I-F CRISPR-associated protein Csy1 [Piscirickettsia litoralis]